MECRINNQIQDTIESCEKIFIRQIHFLHVYFEISKISVFQDKMMVDGWQNYFTIILTKNEFYLFIDGRKKEEIIRLV